MRTEREEENPTNTTPEQFTINRKNPSPPRVRRPSLPQPQFEDPDGIDMGKLWEKVEEKPQNWRNYKEKTITKMD